MDQIPPGSKEGFTSEAVLLFTLKYMRLKSVEDSAFLCQRYGIVIKQGKEPLSLSLDQRERERIQQGPERKLERGWP